MLVDDEISVNITAFLKHLPNNIRTNNRIVNKKDLFVISLYFLV